MRSGSEAGSYLRLIDFVYHSTLGLRVIQKKKKNSDREVPQRAARLPHTSGVSLHFYLTESVYKVVLQKSIPAQIRQLILHICNNKG